MSLRNLCRQPWCREQLSFLFLPQPSDNRGADEHIGRIGPKTTPSHSPFEIGTDPDTGMQNRQLLRKERVKKPSRKRAQFEMQAQVSRKEGGRGGCKRREKYVIGNNPSKTRKQITWIDAVNTFFWIFAFQHNLRSLWLCVTFICSFNSQTNPLPHFFYLVLKGGVLFTLQIRFSLNVKLFQIKNQAHT